MSWKSKDNYMIFFCEVSYFLRFEKKDREEICKLYDSSKLIISKRKKKMERTKK